MARGVKMTEKIQCIGCGVTIQTNEKTGLGFTPASALEKGLETGEVYCQRCFRLRHYNEIQDVSLTDDDFLRLLNEINVLSSVTGASKNHSSGVVFM